MRSNNMLPDGWISRNFTCQRARNMRRAARCFCGRCACGRTGFRFVDREQGLIVPRGNPERLKTLRDIVDRPLRFVAVSLDDSVHSDLAGSDLCPNREAVAGLSCDRCRHYGQYHCPAFAAAFVQLTTAKRRSRRIDYHLVAVLLVGGHSQ